MPPQIPKPTTTAKVPPTRAPILTAGIQVFLTHGYDKASMDLIADAAGVARRTLYNQFPDGKETLFRAAVGHFWQRFPSLIWTESSLKDPRAGLLQAGQAIADFWRAPDAIAFLRLAIAETSRFPDLMKISGTDGKLFFMKDLVDYLDMQVKQRHLVIADTELAMRQFFGMISEPLLWIQVIGLTKTPTPQRSRKVTESAVDLFLNTYAK